MDFFFTFAGDAEMTGSHGELRALNGSNYTIEICLPRFSLFCSDIFFLFDSLGFSHKHAAVNNHELCQRFFGKCMNPAARHF